MNKRSSLTRKVGLAAIATLTAFAGLAPFTPGAGAASNYSQIRYAGANRFDTAALIASAIAEATPTAILARADIFPDALTGAFAAAANDEGPLLLTRSDSVPTETLDALAAESVTDVVLLGGNAAINPSVQTQLEAEGYAVRRLGGANRYGTASAIAADGAAIVGSINGMRTALLSSGLNFPDALSGAPLSFAEGLPSLLTPPSLGDAAARQVFDDEVVGTLNNLNIEQVFILGGPAAVNADVEAALVAEGFATDRLAGANRSGTSVDVFEFGLAEGIYTNRRFGLARGDAFPDALAYGPLGGRSRATTAPTGGPADTGGDANGLLLAAANCTLGDEVEDFIIANEDTFTEGEILGGPAAICEAVANQVDDAASTTGGPVATNVTLSPTTGLSGSSVTATLSGDRPGDITNVTSSNCTITNQAPTNPGSSRTFDIAGADNAVCQITSAITFTDGDTPATTTQTDTFTVTPAPPSGVGTSQLRTSAPDLLRAEIQPYTLGDGSPNRVLFTFDAPIVGAVNNVGIGLGVPTRFRVAGFDSATKVDSDFTGNATPSGSTVLVDFADTIDLRIYSIATVDAAAVNGAGSQPNVLSSKPLGGSSIGGSSAATAGPNLVSTTVDAPGNRIIYTFDKPVDANPGTPDPLRFGFYDQLGGRFVGTTAVRDGGDSKRVNVTFTGPIVSNAVRFFTEDLTPAQANDDADSAVETPGLFPIDNPIGHTGTTTSFPDLTAVDRTANPSEFLFTFDEAVAPVPGGIFAVYDSAGTHFVGSGPTQPSGSQSILVQFALVNSNNTASIVRGGAGNGAAASTSTPPRASTLGAFAISATPGIAGTTDGPDLLSATYDAANSRVTFTFDEIVNDTTAVPAEFFVVSASGAATNGIGAVVPGSTTDANVIIQFPAGTVSTAAGAGAQSPLGTQDAAVSVIAINDVETTPNQNSPASVGGGPTPG